MTDHAITLNTTQTELRERIQAAFTQLNGAPVKKESKLNEAMATILGYANTNAMTAALESAINTIEVLVVATFTVRTDINEEDFIEIAPPWKGELIFRTQPEQDGVLFHDYKVQATFSVPANADVPEVAARVQAQTWPFIVDSVHVVNSYIDSPEYKVFSTVGGGEARIPITFLNVYSAATHIARAVEGNVDDSYRVSIRVVSEAMAEFMGYPSVLSAKFDTDMIQPYPCLINAYNFSRAAKEVADLTFGQLDTSKDIRSEGLERIAPMIAITLLKFMGFFVVASSHFVVNLPAMKAIEKAAATLPDVYQLEAFKQLLTHGYQYFSTYRERGGVASDIEFAPLVYGLLCFTLHATRHGNYGNFKSDVVDRDEHYKQWLRWATNVSNVSPQELREIFPAVRQTHIELY